MLGHTLIRSFVGMRCWVSIPCRNPDSADMCEGLERCAGEVVTDMLEIVETYDEDEAQMQLVMRGV